MDIAKTLEEIKNKYTLNTAENIALFEAMRAVIIVENISKIVKSHDNEFIAEYVKGLVKLSQA